MSNKILNSYLVFFTVVLFAALRHNFIYLIALLCASIYFFREHFQYIDGRIYKLLNFYILIWPISRLLVDANLTNYNPLLALIFLFSITFFNQKLSITHIKYLCYIYLYTGIFFIFIYLVLFFANNYIIELNEPLYYRFGIPRYSSLFGSPGQLGYVVGYLLCLSIFLTSGWLYALFIFLISIFSLIITSRASLIWCFVLPFALNIILQEGRKKIINTAVAIIASFLFLYIISPIYISWFFPSFGFGAINNTITTPGIADPYFSTIGSRIYFSLIGDPSGLIINSFGDFSDLIFGYGISVLGIPIGASGRDALAGNYQIHNGILEVFFAFGIIWSLILLMQIYKFLKFMITSIEFNEVISKCILCLVFIFLVNGAMGGTYFHIWQVSILAIFTNYYLITRKYIK